MKILAIETSCDDTGISIIETPQNKRGGFNVISNIISSQIEVHKKYGGVYPIMAKREHQNNLLPVLTQALKQAKLLNKKVASFPQVKAKSKNQNDILKIKNILKKEEELFIRLEKFLEKYEKPFDYAQGKPAIDLIAVTEGPGLEPCLWVGINFAKALSFFWSIPVVPVNHIESHILVNYLKNSVIKFPAVCLVVSGGHTQLILMNGVGKYKILGETRDDAAGECFDKAAKILGLSYPGGPIISKIASQIKESNIKLPRPMMNTKDYDFSFSGLKTAVLYKIKEEKENSSTSSGRDFVSEMCFEIQQAIIDVLLKKTIKAAKDYKAKTIILGGGVSANQELRKQLAQKIQKELPNTQHLIPSIQLSTDNALMTAITGYFYKTKIKDWKKLEAKANLRIK